MGHELLLKRRHLRSSTRDIPVKAAEVACVVYVKPASEERFSGNFPDRTNLVCLSGRAGWTVKKDHRCPIVYYFIVRRVRLNGDDPVAEVHGFPVVFCRKDYAIAFAWQVRGCNAENLFHLLKTPAVLLLRRHSKYQRAQQKRCYTSFLHF